MTRKATAADLVRRVRMTGLVMHRDGEHILVTHIKTDAWPIRKMDMVELRRHGRRYYSNVDESTYQTALAELHALAVEATDGEVL